MRASRVLSAQPNVLAISRSVEFSARFWLLLLLATGVGAGLAGGLLMRLLYAVQHLAWQAAPSGLYEGVLKAPALQKLLVLGGAGLLVALGVSLLRFAKGGHAGDLTVALWFHAGGMPVVRTLGRSVLSIVIVGLGAALGREGALKQTGAVIGWRWAHWAKLSSEQRRLLTACGAGAGMAAAYNVPLGGALFALEVLLGSISLPYAAPAIVCSVLATVTSWLLLPMQPAYATPHFQLSLNQVGWSVLVGPLIGGAAILYVRLIAWADLHQPKGGPTRTVAPILVFLALGLAAIYQTPHTTIPHPEHRIYAYLLRDTVVERPNQVWCADITYIPMRRGFLYLLAVMDWATRKVLSWRLSNTMEADFCIEALQEALARYGAPAIFNTDQGSQFTSPRFVEVVQAAGARVSMDGRGRWMDNVFIERLCVASSTSASTCTPSRPARSCGLGLGAGSTTTTPPGPTRRTAVRPLTRPTEGLSRTSDWRREVDLNLP